MSYQTVKISSYEAYVEFEYPAGSSDGQRDAPDEGREARLSRFPYAVMLELSYPELDFANRWCWEDFGPADGECTQSHSEYPACDLGPGHRHDGQWTNHWFAKTDYDFGFNEWYFAQESHRDRFRDNAPSFHWGEKYPKTTRS